MMSLRAQSSGRRRASESSLCKADGGIFAFQMLPVVKPGRVRRGRTGADAAARDHNRGHSHPWRHPSVRLSRARGSFDRSPPRYFAPVRGSRISTFRTCHGGSDWPRQPQMSSEGSGLVERRNGCPGRAPPYVSLAALSRAQPRR